MDDFSFRVSLGNRDCDGALSRCGSCSVFPVGFGVVGPMIHELPKCDLQTFLDGIRVYEYCITHRIEVDLNGREIESVDFGE